MKSKGEELFGILLSAYFNRKFLSDRGYNITIENNKRPKFLLGLELDFYIPQLKIAFEFQGEQHYSYVSDFFRNNNDFFKRIIDDIQKDYLCKKEGITLVKVSQFNMRNKTLRRRIFETLNMKYGFSPSRSSNVFGSCLMPPTEYSEEDKTLHKLNFFNRSNMCASELKMFDYSDENSITNNYYSEIASKYGIEKRKSGYSNWVNDHMMMDSMRKVEKLYNQNSGIKQIIDNLIRKPLEAKTILEYSTQTLY